MFWKTVQIVFGIVAGVALLIVAGLFVFGVFVASVQP